MRLYRDDRTELERLIALHGAKGSAEEVLHPPGSVPQFADPGQLRAAWDDGQIIAFPDKPAVTGLERDRSMGELAGRLRAAGRALPRPAPGGARDGALHRRAGARAQRRRRR